MSSRQKSEMIKFKKTLMMVNVKEKLTIKIKRV